MTTAAAAQAGVAIRPPSDIETCENLTSDRPDAIC